jgi:outer membrane protein assembly factor BamB
MPQSMCLACTNIWFRGGLLGVFLGISLAGDPALSEQPPGQKPPIASANQDDFQAKAASQWHQWRGPNADGSARDSKPPIQWSENENIKWKVEVPGKGSSSPIIWEDRIYLMTAIEMLPTGEAERATDTDLDAVQASPAQLARTSNGRRSGSSERRPVPRSGAVEVLSSDAGTQDRQQQDQQGDARGSRRGAQERGGQDRPGQGRGRGGRGGNVVVNPHQFIVLCLDRKNGQEIWRTVVKEAVPHESGHNTNTFSAASPIVDGKRIFANFGSRGFFCLDMNGKVIWEKELGQMTTRNGFGEGSSASVYGETVVIPWDHEGDSFIVALNAANGEEQWRVARDERTTWATPLITPFKDKVQVVTNGTRVRSYDLADGTLLWECGGQAKNPIPSPIRHEDQVVCMTGYQGYAIVSMSLDSSGDITQTQQVSWTGDGAAPYVPSPVLYDGLLYFVKSNNPLMVARDVKTGEVVIEETRLPKMRVVYASPVAAGGHVYFCSREGVVVVVKAGPSGEVVATNDMGETIDASPAIVGNEIYLRGEKHLYCISE